MPAPHDIRRNRPSRRRLPQLLRPNYSGELVMKRDSDYVVLTCAVCDRDTTHRYMPRSLTYEVRTPMCIDSPLSDVVVTVAFYCHDWSIDEGCSPQTRLNAQDAALVAEYCGVPMQPSV